MIENFVGTAAPLTAQGLNDVISGSALTGHRSSSMSLTRAPRDASMRRRPTAAPGLAADTREAPRNMHGWRRR
jgi:hypothetical protein